ncbi:MAG: phosphotransferase [Steroidobacteraceae bacterium]|nr:phosphotransferase [Steroidobacteraceae bacterium]
MVAGDAQARFATWMHEHLGIADARLGERLSGGNANVTQLVETPAGRLVLRRPPDNALSASAARGVQREWRILNALGRQARVPTARGHCENTSVLGQPFIVVDHVDGVAISWTLPGAYRDEPATLERIGHELVDAIAEVHLLDWRELGMKAPDPSADYLAREIERWLQVRGATKVRELPLVERLGAWLTEHKPRQTRQSVIHGDYHLDNTLFAREEPRLEAIIDWELSTVGDPVADLALMLMFGGPRAFDPPGFAFVQAVTRRPGIVTREALAHRWSLATGIDVGDLDYYLAFAFWRLASIVEGAHVLRVQGLVDTEYSRKLEYDVPALLEEAARVAGIHGA